MKQIHTLRAAIAAALVTTLPLAAPAQAEGPVLIELFTSQGCSSCPPADEVLGELATRGDVVALSLHVDYWDYLGWRDTFAQRKFTERQFAYRDQWGERVVYTPQMVVAGKEAVTAYRRGAIQEAIESAKLAPQTAALAIVERDGMLKAEATGNFADRATLWFATYRRAATVPIGRGENAGRTITYHNVVTSLERLGPMGAVGDSIALPQPGMGEGIAIWTQMGSGGPIDAVARFEPEEQVSLEN